MARTVTIAVPGTLDVRAIRQNDFVSSYPGVYWRVNRRHETPEAIVLELWPVDPHDVPWGEAVRELPRNGREVEPGAHLGPSARLA